MTAPCASMALSQASARNWLAVVAVSAGIFTFVTAEMLPVGILVAVAADLGVSEGTAGLMVTAPGVVAAVAALGVALAAGRLDRRLLLCGLLALLCAANVVCALAPNFAVMLAARVAVGLSIGGFWGIAGGLAVRLVPPGDVGRATSIIFAGIAAASVLGVPFGATVGDWAGWRMAFWAVAVLAFAVLVALALLLPALPAAHAIRLSAFPPLLRDRATRGGLIATALIVIGHFAAYTYVSPILQQNGGVGARLIGALLLGYGLAGIVGNFAAGAFAARDVRRTLIVIVAGLSGALALAALVGQSPAPAIALLLVWGLAYGGVSVSLQTWMQKAAPQAVEAANAAWASIFNASIALGAFVGGLAIDCLGVTAVLWLAAAFVLFSGRALGRAGPPSRRA